MLLTFSNLGIPVAINKTQGPDNVLEFMGIILRMDMVRHLTLLTLEHDFYLETIHIEGKKNEIVDSLSRFQMERFWSLAPHAEQTPCPVPSILLKI